MVKTLASADFREKDVQILEHLAFACAPRCCPRRAIDSVESMKRANSAATKATRLLAKAGNGAPRSCAGLFIVGTDTGVGKTYVATRIAAALRRRRVKVGVYKPAASGCLQQGGRLVSTDAMALWEAAGQPGSIDRVCPQRFAAFLSPHLAAREEQKQIDSTLLRKGLEYWRKRSQIVIVEGAGGLMSPIGDNEYVADLAKAFGFPLIVVAPNKIGTINQTLQTLIAAETYGGGLKVAGIVLNDIYPPEQIADPSVISNRLELELRCVPPVVAQLGHGADRFDREVDWLALAEGRTQVFVSPSK